MGYETGKMCWYVAFHFEETLKRRLRNGRHFMPKSAPIDPQVMVRGVLATGPWGRGGHSLSICILSIR